MPATNDPDDYWGKAVTLFTGYPMPSRKTLFDKLSSSDGIPLFRMDIQTMDMRAVDPSDFTAISGWNTHGGEDYDLAFYTKGGGSGVTMHRARIVFIGIPVVDGKGHLLDGGQLFPGGAFTGNYGDEWDLGPLSQYLGGPKMGLDALLSGSTRDVSYSGLQVADVDTVDLKSFERTALAFDRATQFFIDHAKTLEGWEQSLGAEQSSWRGQAAGIFWQLVHQLHGNYDSYVEQLGGTNYQAKNLMQSGYQPKSLFGDALAGAQKDLITQAQNLQSAWNAWSQSYFYDPHRVVMDMLDELTQWVITNNVPFIQEHTTVGHDTSSTTYSTTGGFSENSPYGPLNSISTFKNLAEAAVKKWNEQVDAQLGIPAQQALSTLSNNWIDAQTSFESPLKTKDTGTLSEFYQAEEAKLAAEAAAQGQQGLTDSLNGLGDSLTGLGDGLNGGLTDISNGLNDSLTGLGSGLNDSLTGLSTTGGGLGGVGAVDTSLNGGGLGSSSTTALNDPTAGLGGTSGGAVPLPLNTSLLSTPSGSGSSTANLNGSSLPTGTGSGSLTNPDGSTTTLNSDGSLTTTFPDGSTSTVNPTAGTVTTTNPDGSVSTSTLNPGVALTNPDGSTTTLNKDGTVTTTFPDGSSTTVNPDTGAATTIGPDGSLTTSTLSPQAGSFSMPGGGTSHLNSNGSLTSTFPDGTKETFDPTAGTVTTMNPDGSVTTSPLNPGDSFTNPDGSTTMLNPDGTLTTTFPDGTIQTVNPSTDILQTTAPSGTVTTSDLNPSSLPSSNPSSLPSSLNNLGSTPSTLPSSLNNPSISSGSSGGLPGSTSLLNSVGSGGSGVGAANLNGLGGTSPSSFEEYDSTPFSGGALGAPTSDASVLGAASSTTSGSGGTPLNGMPMGMGGMGGGGAGSGGSSNNERVRNVLGEAGGASLRRSGARAVTEEGEDIVLTRGGQITTSSGSPMYPMGPGGTQGDQSTSSGDRQRAGWGPEDEDVWGTEEDGAPAVIG